MKIAHVLESSEKRGKTCFSLDSSQLRMHFSSVWGIFPELAVIHLFLRHLGDQLLK